MGALPKLGVRWCWVRKKLPLRHYFYAVPLQRTHFWQPREGERLKECLVLPSPSVCGRRRCSHRAFIKGASFICLMGHGGTQHFPWCLCCSHNLHPTPQQGKEPALIYVRVPSPLSSMDRPCWALYLGYLSLSWELCIVLKHSKNMETSHFGGFSGGKSKKTKSGSSH